MTDSLTVTLTRAIPLEVLQRSVAAAWNDLLGASTEVEVRALEGSDSIGNGEGEVRLAIGGGEIVMTVYGVPTHHCLPEEMAAFWAVISPVRADVPADLAGAASVALALAREQSSPVVDRSQRWCRRRESTAAELEADLRVTGPARGGPDASATLAAAIRRA